MVWLLIGLALGIVIANLWLIRRARGPIVRKDQQIQPGKGWDNEND